MPTFITLPTPIQQIRQYAEAPYVDMVFDTTADRLAYLTSPRRYGGMIVVDKEEQLMYFLNTAKTDWLSVSGGTAPALGLGSKEFTITLDGSTGGGEVGVLTLPPIDIPIGSFIAGAFVDVSDGLTSDDNTAYITLGIEVDDETAILDVDLGLVEQLNTNIVTKVPTSLTKASDARLLVAAVGGSNITAGTFKVIVVISDQLVSGGGGGGTDTNFAIDDLTFTGDRTHDLDGHTLIIHGGSIALGMNAALGLMAYTATVHIFDGQLVASQYNGSGTYVGAPVKLAGFDNSGNVIEVDLSAGIDTNFAANDLTLDDNRQHDLDGHNLEIFDNADTTTFLNLRPSDIQAAIGTGDGTTTASLSLFGTAPDPNFSLKADNGIGTLVEISGHASDDSLLYDASLHTFGNQVRFIQYDGSGTYVGTPVKSLAVDSNGFIIETDLGIPDLQAVTDVAFTTTNPILSTGSDVLIGVTTLDLVSGIALIQSTTDSSYLQYKSAVGTSNLKADNVLSSLIWQLPNAGGNLGISVNSAGFDTNGSRIIDLQSVLDANLPSTLTSLHIVDGGGFLLAFNETNFFANFTDTGVNKNINVSGISATSASASVEILFPSATSIQKKINALAGSNPHTAEIMAINVADNFVNDAAAAAGNIRVGEGYHTAGAVRVRLV